MSKKSEIAVLIPAYNAEATLQEAVDSILANTLEVDVVVVDDGSRTPVQTYLRPAHNLTVIRLEKNVGLIAALNSGVEAILKAGYPLLARMDADDICYPERFAKQKAFLDAHPEVGVLGTCGRAIDEHTKETICYYNYPTTHAGAMKALNYNSCFIHPTLCFRSELFKKYGSFSNEYPAAEDYEIIRRFSRHTRLANLPEYLIDYRISQNGISVSKRKQQLATRLKIQREYFEPANYHAWLGILKTLVLWGMPLSLISFLKKKSEKFDKKP